MLEDLKKNIKNQEEWLKKEFGSLRVSRATPALVEDIVVDYYGSKMPIKQLANISAPDPKMLVIQPWDKGALNAIEKAIAGSSLGVNPIVDKDLIRINMPPLTEERRLALVKIVKTKLEESKIAIRRTRDETMKAIDGLYESKKITEDNKFKQKQEAQKVIDEANKNLENISKAKEEEILKS